MELGGRWRIAPSSEDLRRDLADPQLDDSAWSEIDVPGHWRSVPELADHDGPVLYRRRFEGGPPPAGDERAFLVFDGIFYQGDVWFDGGYLGDTEGYFFPHSFEVTDALAAADEHLIGVEVSCPRPTDLKAKRNLTGVFQHWDCIDPDWNPGGIWAGVRVERTGAVRIGSLKVLCREANVERATLDLEVVLDSRIAASVKLTTTVEKEEAGGEAVAVHEQDQVLSAGTTSVRWQVQVERPRLWWPRALGDQPLHRVVVEVGADDAPVSDRRSLLTGLRQVRMRNFVATINGERLFLKGANLGPTRRALAEATPEQLAGDVTWAAEAGLDLLRVHAHITRPELYQAADRQGILIWQDLPLQWGYGNVRRQAVAQARQAVNLLGHHPSVAIWCGHNEPVAVEMAPGTALAPRTVARVVAGQVLPTWNKTGLDRSIRRALERADSSRPVVSHSGVVPHPVWGTDSHFYFGWYHGHERDFTGALSRLPVLARFVSEFGAQAVPESNGFMAPEEWPDLDWDRLARHHCLQREIFEDRVPPSAHATFEGWRRATQEYQATVLRHHIEALRRLKYRPTGGFCLFLLADAQPAVSWSLLDHERVPKRAYRTVTEACAPVIITADRPDASYSRGQKVSLDVHAVSDLRTPIGDALVRAEVRWPGGGRRWRFGGSVEADRCVRIGRLAFAVPRDITPGELVVELDMTWPGGRCSNRYNARVDA